MQEEQDNAVFYSMAALLAQEEAGLGLAQTQVAGQQRLLPLLNLPGAAHEPHRGAGGAGGLLQGAGQGAAGLPAVQSPTPCPGWTTCAGGARGKLSNLPLETDMGPNGERVENMDND